MPTAELNGKTIVITGASSGFGRGSAEKRAAEGAIVVLAARRTQLIDKLAAEIGARGEATAVTMGVSSPKISRAGKSGRRAASARLISINNVAVGAPGFFLDIPIEDHARILDVNVKGLIYGARCARPSPGG